MAKKIKTEPPFVPFEKTTELKKMKLFVTIVNQGQEDFFLDLFKKHDSGAQVTLLGHGTASSEINSLLGLGETNKSIILSVIRQDTVPDLVQALEQRFSVSRRAKGLAFSIPVTSVVGVSIYKFLTNSTQLVRGK
jgi:hypothetical protein